MRCTTPALALGFVLLVSCATTTPTRGPFLREASALRQDGNDLRYLDPSFRKRAGGSIHIAPVELRPAKDLLTADENAEITRHYQQALSTAFARKFTLVPRPGPDTLVVLSTITAVDTVNRTANAVLAVVAVPVDNGGASVETKVLAGKSLVYAESRSVAGGLTGKGDFLSKTAGYLSRTSHVKAALTGIADDLAKRLSAIP